MDPARPAERCDLDEGAVAAATVASAPDAVVVADSQSRVVLFNRAAEQLFGWSRDAIVGRSLDLLIPEHARAPHHEMLVSPASSPVRIRGKAGLGLIQGRRADGSEFPLDATFQEVEVDGHRLFTTICRDATPIIEAEQAAQERAALQERLTTVVATAPGVVCTFCVHADGTMAFPFASPGIAGLFGFAPDELAEDASAALRLIHPLDADRFNTGIIDSAANLSHWSPEFRVRREGHPDCWVEGAFAPKRADDGTVAWHGYFRDMTSRKRMESDVRERERLYRAVMETTADGFFMTDMDGRLIEVNDAYVRRSGFSRAELLAMSIADLVTRESPDEVKESLLNIARQGSALIETEHRTRIGTPWRIEVNASYWPIAGGRMFVFVRDLNHRARSETILRVRLQLAEVAQRGSLDDLMTTALDAAEILTGSQAAFFHFVDPDQEHVRLQAWSTNTLTRLCRAEGKGAHYPVSEAGVWVDCLRQKQTVIHNDYAALPHRRGLPDGHTPITRELLVPVLRDGLVGAIIGVGNKPTDYTQEDAEVVEGLAAITFDIVARKRAEAEVARLVAGSPSITYARPLGRGDETFSWISENVLRLTGYQLHEARQPGWRFAHIHEQDRERVLEADAKLAVEGRQSMMFRFIRRDGREVWMRDERRVVQAEGGQSWDVIGSWSDATDIVELEGRLRQSQKLEAIGQLAGGVAHDFNNLLTVINGYSDILLTLVPAGSEAREYIADIHDAGQRAGALTRQLLAFSRKQVLEPRLLDLNAELVTVEKMLRRLIGEHIVLTMVRRPDIGPVRVDPGQFEQVIINLAVNARDAMPSGGRLTIETAQVFLDDAGCARIPGTRPGTYIVTSVGDTGTGMTPDVQARIFEPFFTTKETGRGTGLGLATVFGIVTQSDGAIDVMSRVGQGTTFRVWLPMAVAQGAEGADGGDTAAKVVGSETILLVEDEEAVRGIARLTLQRFGYHVLTAEHATRAVAIAAAHEGPIHLLLTDVVMPGMSGGELADVVTTARPATRVLFMSGYMDDAAVRLRMSSSRGHLLQKPFTPLELASKVREILDQPAVP